MADGLLTGEADKHRLKTFLEIWRDAGLWLHPEGNLEGVLGITEKSIGTAGVAARTPGPIDNVALWCALDIDTAGDVSELLGAEVERIAHSVMEYLRTTPDAELTNLPGVSSRIDSRLVRIEPLGSGEHKIVVIKPEIFAGYWLTFSRETPASHLQLAPPVKEVEES